MLFPMHEVAFVTVLVPQTAFNRCIDPVVRPSSICLGSPTFTPQISNARRPTTNNPPPCQPTVPRLQTFHNSHRVALPSVYSAQVTAVEVTSNDIPHFHWYWIDQNITTLHHHRLSSLATNVYRPILCLVARHGTCYDAFRGGPAAHPHRQLLWRRQFVASTPCT